MMTIDEALRILGLQALTSEEHLTEVWKAAIISSHPDRCRDESLRALANQRVIDLVEARQLLVAELKRRPPRNVFGIAYDPRTGTYDVRPDRKRLNVPWEW